MISKKTLKQASKLLPSALHARKRWFCVPCDRWYARPRRLRRDGGVVRGECWRCHGDIARMIPPIENGNAFSGPSLVQRMLARAKRPGPKDWSPRK